MKPSRLAKGLRSRCSRDWPQSAVQMLPDSDPTIQTLDDSEREGVADAWSRRMKSELTTAKTFAMLADGLLSRIVEPELSWLAARAVGDEVRHAEICRYVANAYLGRDLEWPTPLALEQPPIGPGGVEISSTLFVVFHCCMNETIATAYLRSCQRDARGALVRAALREILRDEIEHARLGWAHLASPVLSATMRREVGAQIPSFLRDIRALWNGLAWPEVDPPPGHGCPPRAQLARVVDDAIRELILPGLHHVGIV